MRVALVKATATATASATARRRWRLSTAIRLATRLRLAGPSEFLLPAAHSSFHLRRTGRTSQPAAARSASARQAVRYTPRLAGVTSRLVRLADRLRLTPAPAA